MAPNYMAKEVIYLDLASANDVLQFMGDASEQLWVVALNALNPVTMFNEIQLVAWGTGEVRHMVNQGAFSSRFPVYKYGELGSGGIIPL